MSFANNIKAIRKESGLSQEQLAEKLGVSRQSVSKWESGQSYPEMDKILLICKLFNYDIGELMNENVKEVSETKQSKNRINKAVEDFFDYVSRFIQMFTAMSFKQKLKCILEQVVNALILAILCYVVWFFLDRVLYGLFRFLTPQVYRCIVSIVGAVFTVVGFVISLIVMLHIFKIRYLDYYEIAPPEAEEDNTSADQAEEKKSILFSKEREKVIIRDPKHSSSKFLVSLVKGLLLIFKCIVGFFGIFCGISFIFISAMLIFSFLFIKTGVLFVGAFLGGAALLTVNFIALYLIYSFIVSKKVRKNVTALVLIIALAVCGVGAGLASIGLTQFDIIKTPRSAETVFTLPMSDDLSIGCGYVPVKFVAKELEEVKIVVAHSKYHTVYTDDTSADVYIHCYVESTKSFELLRQTIRDINRKEINSHYVNNPIDEVVVYASEENIEKLKKNRSHLSYLEETISRLQEENAHLQELLEEREQEHFEELTPTP